jgi:peptidoglycan/xylan/chitin deacetylase (PgdA/CDA1 family)
MRCGTGADPCVIPVLLYHAVAERPRRGLERWTVRPSVFHEHLDVLVASEATSVTITALAQGMRGHRPLPARALGLTFDDGCASTWEAVRELRRRGLQSTVFVISSAVGRPGWLSAEQVRALARFADVELGAHSVTHPRLDELDAARIAAEVRGSRSQLQALTDAEVTAFAYPHGAYDRRARRCVIDAGFLAAAAVKNALSHADDDPYAIARWTVTHATTAAQIQALLAGRSVGLAPAHERARTRAFRVLRRARRRGLAKLAGAR